MLVYLASPYSHADPAVMVARFTAVCEVAANLMRDGVHLYCPIAHAHPIAQFGLPKGWDYWEQYDRKMLALCNALWVVRLPGWDTSNGVNAEMAIATELGLPIKFIDPAVAA